MALSNAVEGARHTAQQITWTDESGTAVPLTNATVTGYKKSLSTGTAAALDGNLNTTDASNGVFTWTYGSTDVGTVDRYKVQFIATFPDSSKDKTLLEQWRVYDALDV